jgi:hypothetical protein
MNDENLARFAGRSRLRGGRRFELLNVRSAKFNHERFEADSAISEVRHEVTSAPILFERLPSFRPPEFRWNIYIVAAFATPDQQSQKGIPNSTPFEP